MKKFWKVKVNSDLKLSLVFLRVDKDYIDILLEQDSAFMEYIKNENPKYVFITCDSRNYNNMFGWCEAYNDDFLLKNNYVFYGEITFRKEKLNKLHKIFSN